MGEITYEIRKWEKDGGKGREFTSGGSSELGATPSFLSCGPKPEPRRQRDPDVSGRNATACEGRGPSSWPTSNG